MSSFPLQRCPSTLFRTGSVQASTALRFASFRSQASHKAMPGYAGRTEYIVFNAEIIKSVRAEQPQRGVVEAFELLKKY